MEVGKAELVFKSRGKLYFRIFADRSPSSTEAAAEQERLGYSIAKYGKPKDFDCQDLTKGQADDRRGQGFVATWHVEDTG
jgi:hypothetical protein